MKKLVLLLFICAFFVLPATAADIQPPVKQEDANLSAEVTVLYNTNDIDEAQKILNTIPDTDKTALDWLLLGNILQDKNDIKNAAVMFKKSIQVNKKFYRGYYNLGNLYLEDENPNEAIKLYKYAIRYKSNFAYAHYNTGCAYIKLGQLNKAKASFLKAAEHKKNNSDIYYNLAFVYKKLNNTKKAEAYLNFYNQIINENL